MAWPSTALHDEAEDEGSREFSPGEDTEAWGEDAVKGLGGRADSPGWGYLLVLV